MKQRLNLLLFLMALTLLGGCATFRDVAEYRDKQRQECAHCCCQDAGFCGPFSGSR